jgi:4-alpha-glucanotransferase
MSSTAQRQRSERQRTDAVNRLAERYGIATGYIAMDGKRVQSPNETILAALRAMGAEVETPEDLRPAYDRRLTEFWTSLCDASCVAWDGRVQFELRLPSRHPVQELNVTARLEDGGMETATVSVRDFKVVGAARPEPRTSYIARLVEMPWSLPDGYHRLELECGELTGSMFVISAPRQAFQHQVQRAWGTFLPLYSLNTAGSWGAGNYTDLGRLVDWTAGQGGGYAGTLPLLPAFLDQPFNPGPYSPVSRRFWNEFFIDVTAVPELERSEDARQIIASADFQRELEALREAELVDYRRGMALRRRVLEVLAATLLSDASDRRAEFERWLDAHPTVREYAAFRAACERYGDAPGGWPEPKGPGELSLEDYDEHVAGYHAYVQWIAEAQLEAISGKRGSAAAGLYLDLPIGVNGGGYDVWSEPDTFAIGFSVGAPPDRLGPEGQDWGFPPLNPAALRAQDFRHFIAIVRHHMRHAALLRVDHMMGLHRLFWIPDGAASKDGVYVHYPTDELYGILSLESHRNGCELVGEDLGTVPEGVRPKMLEHCINRMIIVPFEVDEGSTTLGELPELALAALNTHDLPPFAGVVEQWFDAPRQEVLVALLREKGVLAEGGEADLEAIISATLEYLGASDARAVLVNLEDLWLETESQNVPGTTDEHPNWRRKARLGFEEFSGSQAVLETLSRLNAARRRKEEDHAP